MYGRLDPCRGTAVATDSTMVVKQSITAEPANVNSPEIK